MNVKRKEKENLIDEKMGEIRLGVVNGRVCASLTNLAQKIIVSPDNANTAI